MSLLFDVLAALVLGVYGIAIILVFIYSFGQLHLVLTFLKYRPKFQAAPPLEGDDVPFITIQLPIYNELFVVERLLDAIAALDYPKDRFEIQLLDDSKDETKELAARKIEELQAQGFQALQVRRPDRKGFKAGALAYGMDSAKGEFIAIFDADFLPRPNFLRATMAQFTSPNIGVVQARWEHINRGTSLFTQAQAFHLDAHFTIEQFARDRGGFFMNFNGTAGIWRKEAITDAGGWEADTLTEDLDLSYRAQLKGWKFRYVDEIGAPAELPAEMGAIKSQQYRWMKGGAEVARKMLFTLWKSDAPFLTKFHGTFHLLSSSVFVLVMLMAMTSVPLLIMKHTIFHGQVAFLIVPVLALLISFLVLAMLYIVTFTWREHSFGAGVKRFVTYYIPFLSISMGLSLHNSIAVIQGFRGKRTPFVRTPKYNLQGKGNEPKSLKKYRSAKVKPSVYGELAFALYFLVGISIAAYYQDFSIIPFMLMQMIGFGAVGLASFRHAAMG